MVGLDDLLSSSVGELSDTFEITEPLLLLLAVLEAAETLLPLLIHTVDATVPEEAANKALQRIFFASLLNEKVVLNKQTMVE